MKQFDEWWVIYTSDDKGGCPKNMGESSFFSKALTIVGEHAFKAGMLAAVEIIEEGIPINVSDRSSCDEKLNYIAESIRKDIADG